MAVEAKVFLAMCAKVYRQLRVSSIKVWGAHLDWFFSGQTGAAGIWLGAGFGFLDDDQVAFGIQAGHCNR